MATKISLKRDIHIDAANAYTATVDGETLTLSTNDNGKGLWIDGQQVEGTSQFSAGKDVAAAYRRYLKSTR